MELFLTCFTILFVKCFSYSIALFKSKESNPELSQLITQNLENTLGSYVQIFEAQLEQQFEVYQVLKEWNQKHNLLFVIDITRHVPFNFHIANECQMLNLVHFVVDSDGVNRNMSFYTAPKSQDYVKAFEILLKYYNWKNIAILQGRETQPVLDILVQQSEAINLKIRIPFNQFYSVQRNIIEATILKSLGVSIFIFESENSIVVDILSVANSLVLDKEGFVWIFGQNAFITLQTEIQSRELRVQDGLIFITCGNFKSKAQLQWHFLAKFLEKAKQQIKNSQFDSHKLVNFLDNLNANEVYQFDIYNSQQNKIVNVGTINIYNNSITWSQDIIFMGPTTNPPNGGKVIIEVSYLSTCWNPDGSCIGFLIEIIHGAELGFMEVNKRDDILPYYMLKPNGYSAGATI